MKISVHPFFVIIAVFMACCATACNEMKNKNESQQDPQQKTDTTIVQKSSGTAGEDDFETPDLEEVYKEYIMYNDTLNIDTTYRFKDKEINVRFRHYCLYDSSLMIPDIYTEMYKITGFVSNTYESSLKVSVDGQPAIDTIIKRGVFNKDVQPELKKYGVLRSGPTSFDRDTFKVHYSLSIPLTDIGEDVEFKDHL